jgi:hypothetical protein
VVSYFIGGGTLDSIATHVREAFRWHHFVAVQIWITVLFLLYVTATELNALLGQGALWRAFFGRPAADLKRARRLRTQALVRLGRLAEGHTSAELRQPGTAAHAALLDLVDGLARHPAAAALAPRRDPGG